MIKTTFINSNLAQYTDKELSWVQDLLLNTGYIADPATGNATFQLEENAVNGHNIVVKAGKQLVDFTKSGNTWKLIVENTADTVYSVPQNVSGSTKYAHIVLKLDSTVDINAVKSNVATIEVVVLATSAPTPTEIQAVIGSGLDFVKLGYVTQVDNNPVITNAMITQSNTTKVQLTKAINVIGDDLKYSDAYFSGASYPSSPVVGRVFYKTTAPIGLQYWNGTTWNTVLIHEDASVKKDNFTANGDIKSKEAVYVTSNNTVKALEINSATASSATVPTSVNHGKSFQLSTSGQFIHFSGGTPTSGASNILAQIGTLDTAETTVTYGSQSTVESTGVRAFDVCQIGTDKFLLIYQRDNGSANGILTKVVTVSGATITLGPAQTIETTGDVSSIPSCSKLDTDKAVIFFKRDVDGDIYSQVLTVSGTSISTNTNYLVKATTGTPRIVSTQLGTDSVAVIYQTVSDNQTIIYGRTISVSGLVITVNAEQTIRTVSSSGGNGWNLGVKTISSTKLLFLCGESVASTADRAFTIAISGSTMTLSGSSLLLTAGMYYTPYFGMQVISSKFALVFHRSSASSPGTATWYLINISGTTPTLITSGGVTASTSLSALVRLKPFIYQCIADNQSNLIKLSLPSSRHTGVAESDIASSALGLILRRYQIQSGFTGLTAGADYYINDDSTPTIQSSLISPLLGTAVNSTDMFLH